MPDANINHALPSRMTEHYYGSGQLSPQQPTQRSTASLSETILNTTLKMHITVVPASPKTGQATIRALLADPSNPTVKGYYRDLSKVPAEFKSDPRFEAVQG